jgi:hypothetical protein
VLEPKGVFFANSAEIRKYGAENCINSALHFRTSTTSRVVRNAGRQRQQFEPTQHLSNSEMNPIVPALNRRALSSISA